MRIQTMLMTTSMHPKVPSLAACLLIQLHWMCRASDQCCALCMLKRQSSSPDLWALRPSWASSLVAAI